MLRIRAAYPIADMNGTSEAHVLLSNGAVVIVTVEGDRRPELAFRNIEGRKVMALDPAFFPGPPQGPVTRAGR